MIVHKILKSCRRFKAYKIRKEDAVFLWFLSVYKHGLAFGLHIDGCIKSRQLFAAERVHLVDEKIEKYKEAVLTEWITDLCRVYGEHEGGKQ